MKKPTRSPLDTFLTIVTLFCVGVMVLWAVTSVARFVIWLI